MAARILIVEDHSETARHLVEVFGAEGFDTKVAVTGEQGLACVAAEPFDALVLDYHLPLMNGVEVLEELRRQQRTLPVILVTVSGHPDVTAAGLRAGAFACVEKHLRYPPVVVAKLRDALAGRSLRTSLPHVVRPAFVGREEEMTVLEDAFADVRGGRGGLVWVVGDAGIGKSTLARQAADRAQASGFRPLWAKCRAVEGSPAYSPWVEIHRRCREWLVGERGASPASSEVRVYVDRLMTEVGSAVPVRWDAPLPVSHAARLERYDAVVTCYRQLAAWRPLLLLFEDLHLADSASLQLLAFFAEHLHDSSLLILGTFRMRDVPGHEPAVEELRRIATDSDGYVLELRPFTHADTARYVELATGWEPSEALVSALFRKTEGHPLFTVEVLRLLAAEGRLDGRDGADLLSALPASRVLAVERRLRLLPEPHREVLSLAALLGRQFALPLLHDVAGAPADHVDAAVEEAVAHRLLTDEAEELRFAHELVRDELARSIGKIERAEAHRRIGEAIERRYAGDLEPRLGALAHHFLEAARYGEPRAGVEYAIRAGDREARLMAYPEAAELYTRALRADARVPVLAPARRCALLVKLAETEWRAGRFARARDAGREAVALARTLEEPHIFARAVLGFAGQLPGFGVGSDAEVVGALEEALHRLGGQQEATRPLLLVRLAQELTFSGRTERQMELLAEALEDVRIAGDPQVEAAVHRMSQWTVWTPEGIETRRGRAAHLVALGRRLNDRELQLNGKLLGVWIGLEHADPDAVATALRAAVALARSLRLPYYDWLTTLAEACVALSAGRLTEALDLAERAHQLGHMSGNPNATLFFGALWAHVHSLHGKLPDVEAWLAEMRDHVPALALTMRCVRAVTFTESNRPDDARAELDALGPRWIDALPSNATWFMNAAFLAEVTGRVGDTEQARAVYSALVPFKQYHVLMPPILCGGAVAHHLGTLATALGRADDARRHFESALGSEARLGSVHLVARTQVEYAGLLVQSASAADQERARRLVDEARETAGALDLPILATRCDEVDLHAGSGRAATSEPVRCIFRPDGDGFVVQLDDTRHWLQYTHGMQHLHELLSHAGEPLSCEYLVRMAHAGRLVVQGDGGQAVDPRARREVEADVRRLEETLERHKAELSELVEDHLAHESPERVHRLSTDIERLEDEIEDLRDYLRRRGGQLSHTPERCRQNVWHALETAYKRIAKVLTPLAMYLKDHVQRGDPCVYRPDVHWLFDL